MKGKFWVFLALLLLCTACGTQALPPAPPENEEPPEQSEPLAAFLYDPYRMDSYTLRVLHPQEELYRLVFDAVDAFAPCVPLAGRTLTEEEAAAVSAAVLARFEFSYFYGASLSPDGTELVLHYAPSATAETAKKDREAFRAQVQYLLTEVANPAYSTLENVLAVYRYFSQCSYREDAEDVGAYGMMVRREGICTGYAYALRYILDQLDIPSELAFSEDESHVWNLVTIEGKPYHLDATWESLAGNETERLNFFGMSDAQRARDFAGWYGGGNSNYPPYPLPAATDERFAPLWDSKSAAVDFAQHTIVYLTQEGKEGSCELDEK